jgi:enhancing lycopene biosynthesis protein 2
MTKVAVILSGCGHMDGAEIRESVLSLLYLDQQGAEVEIFAPDIEQRGVINHKTGKSSDETRNVLVEAARIARGQISDLEWLDANGFDALIIPGGFGVAKNLSDFAEKGPQATILPSFAKAVKAFYEAGKPIGAICIAPAVLAAILKGESLTLSIGEDKGTAQAIESLGHTHQNCPSDDAVVDSAHQIATCSAYMRDDSLSAIASGIEKVVYETLQKAEKQPAQRHRQAPSIRRGSRP